uniref:Uncharacterized protein LOC111105496 isoform X1 n=1 Tax=Crassostrea virginica TaxID=6565 RepID=A0A8B8AWH9_CRAVI|nr:uncharacterized protein LOC111105496 isoform X1 [Crassostrea virginica]
MRMIGLCFIVLCGCYCLVKGNRHCSWSNKTVEVVSSCPTSNAEVEERKLKKNCMAFANLQNCTEPDKFLYHCVIDDLETSFVEVCAPVYIINRYCAEYNIVGAIIQPHYKLKCNDVKPPCAAQYNSTDAYLYKGCYAAVKRVLATTEFTVIQGEEKIPEKVLGITVGVLIAVIFGVLCAFRTRQALRRKHTGVRTGENEMVFVETHFK